MSRSQQCVQCKGRGFCGLPKCPITSRFYAKLKEKPRPFESYMGESPSVFIGSYSYPKVAGGPMMTAQADDPEDWVKKGCSIDDIVAMRSSTVRGSKTLNAAAGKAFLARTADSIQEVAISQKPIDIEVAFEKPVSFDLKFDGTLAPVGLSGEIKKMDVLDNAFVPRIVDKITSDGDLRAVDGMYELFKGGIDVHHIQNVLGAGLLGIEKNRRFVPTRWGITAIDDSISRRLKSEVMKYPPISDVTVFSGAIHANHIVCMLVPGDWKFEMIEIWEKNSMWTGDSDVIVVDSETKKSKNDYSPIGGAYYSARLAVLEYLSDIRRNAEVILVRRATKDYWAPLGTWVIREATRNAMNSQPVKCEDTKEGADTVTKFCGGDTWLKHSRLYTKLRTQKSLFDF